MTYRPTIRQLSFLVALAEHQNFSRAAEAMFVTQSTLSAGIQELELLLGAALVERTKRMVRLTALGEAVVARAETILNETDDLVGLVKGAAEPLTGDIRLGAIPTIGPFILPRALPVLKKKYPRLKLFLREGQTEETLDLIKKGALDLGLIAFPYSTPALSFEIIGTDRFSLVCPPEHPMASKNQVEVSEIPEDQLLLLEEGHCLRDHALSVCHIHNLEAREQFKATSLETLVLMVAEGLGLTLVPDLAIKAGLLKGKKLKAIPLKGTGAGREIGLCWRASNPRAEEFNLLAQELGLILKV